MNKRIMVGVLTSACLLLSIIGRFSISVKGSSDVAPDFTLTDIDGNVFSLSDYRGKVVLLDFFGTWCPVCVQEIPHLKGLYEEFSEKLVILSISSEDEEVLRDFRDEYCIEWTVARDTANVFDAYNVSVIPTLVIIDQEGYICYTHVGLTEESVLRSEIESLLLKTIYVDDDNTAGPWDGTQENPYQNITSGLEHASAEDTIYVYNGTYYENVVVNKTVSLIGENRSTTIIDGMGIGIVVWVQEGAENVTISGFTIQNGYGSNSGIDLRCSGIGKVRENIITNGIALWSNNSIVSQNTIRGGIIVQGSWSNDNTISENVIIDNSIELHFSHNNAISGNTIKSTWTQSHGILLYYSHDNIIYGNLVENMEYTGIVFGYSIRNVVYENTMRNNKWGIILGQGWEQYGNTFYHNNFINNTEHARIYELRNNTWDNGYASGGNYWSDYEERYPDATEIDDSGIWDTPYIINGTNQDNYPLIHPYGSICNLDTNLTYLTIQSAIDAPETLDGHTIFVEAGTYHENVVVNKTVSLLGENVQNAIIDGGGTGNVVHVSADYVNVTGFTIQNSGIGIYLESASYCNITGNNITNNDSGIRLEWSSNYDSISENSITENNYYGVWLSDYSNYNSIVGNNVTANNLYGIYLSQSSYNSISGNVFVNDGLAVSLSYGNVVDNNLVNGKPLIYLEGVSDYVVEDAGQVVLVNCNRITVKNLNLSNTAIGIQLWKTINTEISGNNIANNRYGVELIESSYNSISINNITNNDYGIYLYYSSSSNIVSGNNITANDRYGVWLWLSCNNNTISGNNIANNDYGVLLDRSSNFNTVSGNNIANNQHGVVLSQSSNYNSISGNTITANSGGGIGLRWWCMNNSISANTITGNNGHGIELHWQSNDNSIYHNNFIGNTIQAYTINSLGNSWDDGYPSGGNYWSDYTGVDLYSGPHQNETGSDGIGDTSYTIDANNMDRYPLMNPWTPIETIVKVNDKDYPVTIVSNTTINQMTATANTLHFTSSGPTGQKAYVNVIFPMVNTTEIKVFIDDVKLTPPPFPVINTNGTHYFIYFEFTLSIHDIAIQFAPVEYTLAIDSSPTGVTFTVDGVSHTTPWSGTYDEGTSVDLAMPEIHAVGEARYYWDQWSDEVTSRSRAVTMNTNITLTAYYTGPYYELTVTSSPITGITFTIDGVPETTPYTEWLLEGSYTLEMLETHNGYVWSHWLEDGATSRTKTITLPGTTWTGVYVPAPPPPAVGGEMILVKADKPPLLAPTYTHAWIGLISAIISTVAVSVVHAKHRRRKQTE